MNVQRLQECCPKLHELSAIHCRADVSLARAWHSRMDYMAFYPWNIVAADDLADCDWTKLRKLGVIKMSLSATNRILDTAQKLREIYFIPNTGNPPRTFMAPQDIDTLIRRFIVDYPDLEFLYVSTRGHLEKICSAIHHGLFRTKTRSRNKMEIGLMMDCDEITDGAEFICNLSRIINVLNMSDIREWIVSVEGHHKYFQFEHNALGAAIDEMVDSVRGFGVRLMEKTQERFIIGNEGCRMTPHRQKWMDGIPVSFY